MTETWTPADEPGRWRRYCVERAGEEVAMGIRHLEMSVRWAKLALAALEAEKSDKSPGNGVEGYPGDFT